MNKVFKKIVYVISYLVILIFVNVIISYSVVDDANDEFRTHFHKLYNQQENIDVLFLGSSHVFCGVDPYILDEMWNEKVFLGSSSVQKPDMSYYILKEAISRYDLKKVYLEMYDQQYQETDTKNRVIMSYLYGVSDNLPNYIDRMRLIWDGVPREHLLRGLFPAIRYGDKLLDFEYTERVIKSKRNENYKSFVPAEQYHDGYIAGGGITVEEGSFISLKSDFDIYYGLNPIKEYSLFYLRKIVELCKKENIELTLFTTPTTDYNLSTKHNYNEYFHYVEKFAEENDIIFWDFNMLNYSESRFNNSLFSDSHHLNSHGAKEFTKLLAKVDLLYNETGDVNNLFVNSLAEKWENENRFVGLVIDDADAENGIYKICPVFIGNEYECEYIVIGADDIIDDSFRLYDNKQYEIEIQTRITSTGETYTGNIVIDNYIPE